MEKGQSILPAVTNYPPALYVLRWGTFHSNSERIPPDSIKKNKKILRQDDRSRSYYRVDMAGMWESDTSPKGMDCCYKSDTITVTHRKLTLLNMVVLWHQHSLCRLDKVLQSDRNYMSEDITHWIFFIVSCSLHINRECQLSMQWKKHAPTTIRWSRLICINERVFNPTGLFYSTSRPC